MKGRKRHILVHTQGFLITAQVKEANLHDRDGLQKMMEKIKDDRMNFKTPYKRLVFSFLLERR